ncbi:ergothioneine biosynthesis glutamate--cysteine ligase EgtA [Actinoplanes sp. LDG1-06]|uniref:Glutamate--cysteine ligase EgtA n=1 Tax=Paractinoplanes ovalisporus TaxID=2810368 RepID=A0ABS2AIH9_9ACTN|nr:ergothioneine biosynthesis glutamate--cysteine ligase EgtA [Actinoplanes ovalisporus]MBM2619631.1 ergothioneine biosynthesis glutamate--cysteine ligase EgtA [Actinoplanes ovalisporus]
MTKSIRLLTDGDADTAAVLRTQSDVEARIRAICFKTGPPSLIGAELEWTLHHTAAPSAPLSAEKLRQALGPHTPATLGPPAPAHPLPAGGTITVEPGGQVEISSAPASSLTALHAAVSVDLAHLSSRLGSAGLTLGRHGVDAHREPRRLVHTPRYSAMEQSFDARGPDGRVMMCSTAGLQVCLDAGTGSELATRWAAVSALGPPLLAAFANSRRRAGRDTGLASARMAAWWAMDPRLTHPVGTGDDPAGEWVRYALAAPLTCVRRDGGCWDAPPGVTLGDWVGGALPWALTTDDVDYHLTTLFPPVRPHGYLEVRYLDAQAGDDWFAPVAVLAALLADPATTGQALDLAQPVADRWVPAYERGLDDPALRRAATAVLDLAARRLSTAPTPASAPHSASVAGGDRAQARLLEGGPALDRVLDSIERILR